MTTSPSRQPKGIPVGGQFAAAAHSESGVSLDQNDVLTVAAGTDPALAEKLTAGGLKGSLAPYSGNNPDAGENPHTYTSPGGRELILSSSEDEGFRAMYDDRYDEETFSIEIAPEDADARGCAGVVHDALWQLALNDANSEIPAGLRSADYYELQEVTLERGSEGGFLGEIRARNDDDSETVIRHELSNAATTVYRDGEKLDGLAADWELAAVFEGLRSEPGHGDFYTHTHEYFQSLRGHAAKDRDAPDWAKTEAN